MATFIVITKKTSPAEIALLRSAYSYAEVINFTMFADRTPELKKIKRDDKIVIFCLSHFGTAPGIFDLLYFVVKNGIELFSLTDNVRIPGFMNFADAIMYIYPKVQIAQKLWKQIVVRKEAPPKTKFLSTEGLKEVKNFLGQGMTQKEIASEMGCHESTISLAVGKIKNRVSHQEKKEEKRLEKYRQITAIMKDRHKEGMAADKAKKKRSILKEESRMKK